MEFKPNKKYKQAEGLSLIVNENGQCTVFVKNPVENPHKSIPYNTYDFKCVEDAFKAIEMTRIYGDENELATRAIKIDLWRVPMNFCPCCDAKTPHKATVKGFKPMTWNDEFFWYGEKKVEIESRTENLDEIPFEIQALIHLLKRVKIYKSSDELKFSIKSCPRLLEFMELVEKELGGEILNQETHIRYYNGDLLWKDYDGNPKNFIENFAFKEATIHGLSADLFLSFE